MRSKFCSSLHSQVSKNDNLAGIAVKYGISVSDIKKANGLLSDNIMSAQCGSGSARILQLAFARRHLVFAAVGPVA